MTVMENRLIDNTIYNNLPEDLKILTSNFEGREKDIVLLSSLGVISNVLPNIKGTYDGDIVYPHMYVLIVAPPASGKGVMNYSRMLIEPIHQAILANSKQEKSSCEDSKKKDKQGKKEPCPNIRLKIVPANISTSELYTFLGNSKDGLLIMESEADTLSVMMNNDWSNYSDVLRKCFHHEPLSIARKIEDLYEEISEPKLSVVISGTPGQLKPFLKSRENGLFSRFAIYTFDEVSQFKNVFELKSNDNKELFSSLGSKLFNLYGDLHSLTEPVDFELTENQRRKFLSSFGYIWSDIVSNHTASFLANLNRHGLMLYKIAMILSTLRRGDDIVNSDKIVCEHRDFLVALRLTQTILRHSKVVFDSMDTGFLSMKDEEIIDSLSPVFTREDIVKKGTELEIPVRTIDDKLRQFQVKKVIKKVSKGVYKKL